MWRGHVRQLILGAGHTSMRSQMAAAVGRLAGLGCRHSSMSADTTAGPSSGTSMSLQRHAPVTSCSPVTSPAWWSQRPGHSGSMTRELH